MPRVLLTALLLALLPTGMAAVDIEKTTDSMVNLNPIDSDFDNEDDANGVGVPVIEPGSEVVWTYLVTNTGTVEYSVADINVTDSVAGVNPVLQPDANSADGVLSPGESWFYEAVGTALDLSDPAQTVGLTIVPGCNPNATPGGERDTYANTGTVTVPDGQDSDTSHYCNPEVLIDIEKTTDSMANINPIDSDFDNEDDPNGAGVPVIGPGSGVTWTYRVTNTGVVAIPLADITVTDSVAGVNPVLQPDANSADGVMSPGESWSYQAAGTALDLSDASQTIGLTIVPGCNPNAIPGEDRNTYVNTGTVTVPGGQDSDPSHYCNPEVFIDIEKTTDSPANENAVDSDFDNEDDPNGVGVPVVEPGATVTWTYRVTNTGLVEVPLADITVTDSVAGVNPVLQPDANSSDGVLSPGESWSYQAVGTAANLSDPAQTVGLTIVPGCNPMAMPGQERNTYVNTGTVTVPGGQDSDPSHYCNREDVSVAEIDIKPGSNVNPVNPMSQGVIPVAILGSDSFDVLDVDPDTLAFGPDGAALAHTRGPHYEDVNDDGLTDLLGHFRTQETGIAWGDTSACLTWESLDGTPAGDCDDIVTVPACGVGFELAFALPPLMWLRRRLRRVAGIA